jgi:hypothetical protein
VADINVRGSCGRALSVAPEEEEELDMIAVVELEDAELEIDIKPQFC